MPRSALLGLKVSSHDDRWQTSGGLLSFPRTGCAPSANFTVSQNSALPGFALSALQFGPGVSVSSLSLLIFSTIPTFRSASSLILQSATPPYSRWPRVGHLRENRPAPWRSREWER